MRKEQTPIRGFNGFESADCPSDCVMSKISLAHDGHARELGTWHRPYALKPSIEKPPARAVDHLLDRQGAARLSFLTPYGFIATSRRHVALLLQALGLVPNLGFVYIHDCEQRNGTLNRRQIRPFGRRGVEDANSCAGRVRMPKNLTVRSRLAPVHGSIAVTPWTASAAPSTLAGRLSVD